MVKKTSYSTWDSEGRKRKSLVYIVFESARNSPNCKIVDDSKYYETYILLFICSIEHGEFNISKVKILDFFKNSICLAVIIIDDVNIHNNRSTYSTRK